MSFLDEQQWLIVLVYSLLLCLSVINCDDQKITGCAGFVKTPAHLSKYKLKYDDIQIHLVTADGAVKDKTECAPHNGYFFVPTFERGSYKLRVVPPSGWHFEPSEYEVIVNANGKDNTCEDGRDLNFILAGFTVQGQIVTKGYKNGPENVEISLSSSNDQTAKPMTVKSAQDGKFSYSPVLPGSYKLTVENNADLHLEQTSVPVEVSSGNVNSAGPLTVIGFSVQGSVSSEKEPVLGVKFLLFTKQKGKKTAIDCDSKLTPSDGFKSATKGDPECYVTSNAEGNFRFQALVPGQYEIVPFYKSGKTQFDVKPADYKFTVGNAPIKITPNFEVSGFSVAGSVKLSPDSKGIEGAEILVNGKSLATTDATGKFLLEKMTVGHYTVGVRKNGYAFDQIKVQLVPSKPELQTIFVSKVKVCGSLSIRQFPEGRSKSLARKVEVVTHPSGDSKSKPISQSVTADESGTFCSMVTIGQKSTFKAVVTNEEKAAGLMFKKSEISVDVKDVMDVKASGIVFEQWLTSVSGEVQCIDGCKPAELSIKLAPKNNQGLRYAASLTMEAKSVKFSFDSVLFDVYTVSIGDAVFCWKTNHLRVDAISKPESSFGGLKFEQTGFVLNVATDFSAVALNYEHKSNSNFGGTVQDARKQPKICLPGSGDYKLTTESCFKFDEESYELSTSQSKALQLTLNPKLFKVESLIESPSDNFEISVAVNDVKQEQVTIDELEENKKWKLIVYAKKGDVVKYTAESSTLLFKPSQFEYQIDGSGCPGNIVKFQGRPGEFLEASLSVQTPDVTVEVLDVDGNVFMHQTTSDKQISIGPLEDKSKYSVKLSKPGYIFTEGKGGLFTVNKLASIAISVKDEADQPLVGALMSVSDGDRQYRSNNLTNSEGKLLLLNLGPGEYFIKPLKKEFTFSPANKLLKVGEGENSVVHFTAVRTAFTCHGLIKTPSLDSKAGVTVFATGIKGTTCEHAKEEGVSQSDGTFTILGLQANCGYEVSVRLDKSLHYAVPLSKRISVEKRDVTGVNFVVFPVPNNDLDLNGYVDTTDNFLPSLTVSLYSEEQSGSGGSRSSMVPLESHSLDNGGVPFFFFTTLTRDEKWYTLRLESTLSRSEYSYNLSEHTFQASTASHHVRFSFTPVRNMATDDDVTQGGLLLPLLIVLAGICTYNYQKVKGPMHNAWVSLIRSLTARSSNTANDQSRGSNNQKKNKKSLKAN